MPMEFASPQGFARYLAEVRVALIEAEHEGLKKGAEILVAEIKAEMGHYQGAVNGLPAWQELADRTKEERQKAGFTENEPLRRSGGLADSVTYTIDGHTASVGSPDPIMKWQEEGTPDARFPIPPRPVIGGSLFRRVDDIVKAMVMPSIRVLEGKL